MTLPLTGVLKFSEINTELGRASTSLIQIDKAENGDYSPINTCGFPRPSSGNPATVSEWYGYDHNAPCNYSTRSSSYSSYLTDYMESSAPIGFDIVQSDDFSFSFWLKPKWGSTSARTSEPFLAVGDTTTTSPRIAIQFLHETTTPENNLFLYVEDEFGGTVIYEYSLDSASNSSITGVTGSGASKNWEAGYDWAHIVVVYNGGLSQSARSQVYWDGSQLTLTSTTSTATLSGNIATTSSVLYINAGIDAVINVFDGNYLMDDMTWYYQTALTSTNAFDIYNGGLPTDYTSLSSISTSLYHYNFENAGNLGEEYLASFDLNNFGATQSTDVP
jgi:hypothetical protein